jgi:quercetin dioxygenase-like cupin family protein
MPGARSGGGICAANERISRTNASKAVPHGQKSRSSAVHNGNMEPYTFLENIEAAVPIPENGILSRTLFNDEAVKIVAFGFSPDQELSAHTAPMAAMLYFIRGEAELTLGAEKKHVRAGAFVHMPPQTPHGILAKTPVTMLLLMLKQVRGETAR